MVSGFTACIVLFSLFWCSCDAQVMWVVVFTACAIFFFSYFGAQVMWIAIFTACVVSFFSYFDSQVMLR